MLEPNWAPTLEYVAIPLGSSSAAPVTSPGPNILSVFRNQLSDLGEVSVTVAPANSRILGSAPIGSLVEASDSSFPFGDKFTRSVRIERADPSYLFDFPNNTAYDLGNGGPSSMDQRVVADAGFLELVRLGIKPAYDLVIINSLQVSMRRLARRPSMASSGTVHPRWLRRNVHRRSVGSDPISHFHDLWPIVADLNR
jgi:hypothetical protein